MKTYLIPLALIFFVSSCASKKDLFYFQDSDSLERFPVAFEEPKIQPNDILKITVNASVPEATIPYNSGAGNNVQMANLDVIKLEGYVVSNDYTIEFPVLGTISAKNLTPSELSVRIKTLLKEGNHLADAGVVVRLLNAKFTVLGEVRSPGTFSYTETNLTFLQALGYAGDLTLNGKRDDIILIREVGEDRKITHINLVNTDWVNTEAYQIKPNDIILVKPNERAVNSSGVIDTSILLGIAGLTLSVVILLTR